MGFIDLPEGIATLLTFIFIILAITGGFLLWYKFRKSLWAFGISFLIAVIVSALIPLITTFVLQTVIPELNISSWDIWAQIIWHGLQSSFLGISLKWVINLGFDVSRWEPFGKQS